MVFDDSELALEHQPPEESKEEEMQGVIQTSQLVTPM